MGDKGDHAVKYSPMTCIIQNNGILFITIEKFWNNRFIGQKSAVVEFFLSIPNDDQVN